MLKFERATSLLFKFNLSERLTRVKLAAGSQPPTAAKCSK